MCPSVSELEELLDSPEQQSKTRDMPAMHTVIAFSFFHFSVLFPSLPPFPAFSHFPLFPFLPFSLFSRLFLLSLSGHDLFSQQEIPCSEASQNMHILISY